MALNKIRVICALTLGLLIFSIVMLNLVNPDNNPRIVGFFAMLLFICLAIHIASIIIFWRCYKCRKIISPQLMFTNFEYCPHCNKNLFDQINYGKKISKKSDDD